MAAVYFSLLTLIASVICIAFGVVVYSFNKRALLNKIFFLTSIFAFFYAFTEVMMWQSGTFEDAYFWSKIGSIWPFFVVLVFHFTLIFTKSSWLKNNFTLSMLYLPAVLFCFIGLFTQLINASPIMEYWGYEDVSTATIVNRVSTLWAVILPVLSFVVCFRYYRSATDETQRQQRKFVTIGLAIPIFTYVITNMAFPSVGITTPNLGHFAVLFFSLFAGYAILKHGLFTFDAAMAAENIISTIPDSFILADINGKMIRVNNRLVAFLGYEEKDLFGESLVKICAENKRCLGILEELMEKRLIRNYELTCRTKLGEEKPFLFSGSVVRSKTGEAVGFTCIIHDITDRKSMEERLVKAERFASIGELAGQIGHDLRNPLTGIKSGVYLIRKKGANFGDADRKMVLDMIDNAIADSNRIINSLMDYSSDVHLQMDRTTVKSVLSRALLGVQVPDRISIVDYTSDEPELFLDAPKMERVFASIVQNAIEAIPETGKVEIRSFLLDSAVEVTFTDFGVGIPEGVLSKIFSPLITTKAKGMGLSLAICRRIVDAHGGKVGVESQVGKGSVFTVTLPLEQGIEVAL
jgi:PAS domain S-box-containing protein